MKKQVQSTVERVLTTNRMAWLSKSDIRRAGRLPVEVEITARIRALRSRGYVIHCERFPDGIYRYSFTRRRAVMWR